MATRTVLSDPRSFCEPRFPWPLIHELEDGAEVRAVYLLLEKRSGETKHGKRYLTLLLADRSGNIEAKVWDDADRVDALCAPDSVIGVVAKVSQYQGKLQLTVAGVEPLAAEAEHLELLLPASPRDRATMLQELDRMVASVECKALRALLRRCVGPATELGRAYRLHPAAKRNHHAYLGGLLEHSLSVAGTCVRLAEHYGEQGVLDIDRDLLVTGALLHDIGKVRELMERPGLGYTTAGQLLGHIVLGIQMVAAEAEHVPALTPERLLMLQHLIASHQGKPEWDSPKVPQMIEALILHYADDLDAKLNQAGGVLAGVAPGEWSAYDRGLGRAFYRPPGIEAARNVEPVAPDEVDFVIDLFRGS